MSDQPNSGGDRFAGEQAASYRRGFVLGLTMAETILLLTFVVLMLLVVGFARRELQIAAARQDTEALEAIVRALHLAGTTPEERDRRLAAVVATAEAAAAAGIEWDDAFVELVKGVISHTRQDASLVDIAKALRDEKKAFDDMRRQLEDALGGDADAGKALQELIAQAGRDRAEVERLTGKNRDLTDQVKRLGGVLPSCWVENGRPVYVFDVVLASDGLRMRDRAPERFRPERDRLLGSAEVDPGRTYTPAEFHTITRPMFDDSVKQECRYYVVIYDGTAADEKSRYKALMQTVEGHFYKRQSSDTAPF